MSKPAAQIIDPKEFGRQAFEQPLFSPDAVKRADAALKAMSGSFQQWLEDEINTLQQARLAGEACGWTEQSVEAVFSAAHDLKGLGATYEYPLATKIAASLCRLIETEAGRQVVRRDPQLMLAHVDAIRAAARDQVKTSDHPVGRMLLQTLEARVAALGVAPR